MVNDRGDRCSRVGIGTRLERSVETGKEGRGRTTRKADSGREKLRDGDLLSFWSVRILAAGVIESRSGRTLRMIVR